MTCHITEDDRCQRHGTPLETMHDCPHDGFVCMCGHPSCHVVKSRRETGPLGRLLPLCVLCGTVGRPTDADGIKEARQAHEREVLAG